MTNEGKESVVIDLKSDGAKQQLRLLIEASDIVHEQFCPGVLDRLGIGYWALAQLNPSPIYCAVTGYGQSGPDRMKAGHET
ncbi:hypothetical protein CBW24_16050 (plasmid) [Pacificitalea manganoxidans]|uniref:Uncharacterized protein n=1 Tax=Pacificitalea manganoxidans TaxID=1411902 RepID=A0A291M411_9RHOB|nr:hypothetical protein CBW24_16050 [Pacificitalea manganoxidans]